MLRKLWHSAEIAERWDLYVLALIALVNLILELTTSYNGVGLLTIAVVPLTIILLRLRETVERIQNTTPAEQLSFDAFRDLDTMLSNAREIWLHTGTSISGLLSTDAEITRRLLRRVCQQGTRVNVLISEPTASSYQSSRATEPVSAIGPTTLLRQVLTAELDVLAELVNPDAACPIKVHFTDYPQPYGLLGINPRDYDGHLVVVLPEFGPQEKVAALSLLAARNRQSYTHFLDEAIRLWNSGSNGVDSGLIRDVVTRFRSPSAVSPRPRPHRTSQS